MSLDLIRKQSKEKTASEVVTDGAAQATNSTSGTLPASETGKYYNGTVSTDIVGTVSESSGTPTGAILESGSNADGEYIKYADGTMICTSVELTVSPATGPSGGYYYSRVSSSYPAVFIAIPNVSISLILPSYAPANLTVQWFQETNQTPTGSTFKQTFVSPSSGKTINYKYIAIGRWY